MSGFSKFCLKKTFLLGLCVLLAACDARSKNGAPTIEFTRIPMAGEGGPDRQDSIAGRVTGARPGQQIVLYARWGPWYVQPLADQPFTKIEPDAKWGNSTHFGVEYAALLVEPEYHPPATLDVLPKEGGGVITVAVTKGRPAFWQTWWFLLGTAATLGLAVVELFRMRMRKVTRQLSLRLEERLAERTRIAQELHDTLLQDFLSVSMQLHVANDQLAADSPVKPLLTRVLDMMGGVIEEGRNTLQGLRSSNWRSRDLEQAFSRIQQELGITKQVRFRVIVEGVARPLQPMIGDDIYLIGREALANAFHHSGANEIEVELDYADTQLKVLVRDNGCGLANEMLRSGRDRHWGLPRMRARAERIGAKFRILSRKATGTEIELSVDGHVAYISRESDRRGKWFSLPHVRSSKAANSSVESEQV